MKEITPEKFDQILCEIVGDLDARTIIGIPGVYEVFSEHFNNEVLDQWREELEEPSHHPGFKIGGFIND